MDRLRPRTLQPPVKIPLPITPMVATDKENSDREDVPVEEGDDMERGVREGSLVNRPASPVCRALVVFKAGAPINHPNLHFS